MSDQPFRFLHSADFQLDQPLYGLTEIPDHLRSALIEGAYRAAERVFDTAISEKVAFVCLTGDLLNLAHPTARSISFLREQFERLDEQGLAVYWSGRHQDSATPWPALITLPASIHHFGASEVETITHEAPAGLVVDVLGQSGTREVSVAEFCAHASGHYSVAVATGQVDSRLLATRSIEYWALGGQSDRKTLFTEPSVAHYPGTPQGRCPLSIGAHGCTVVEVRPQHDTRLRFVPCDVVRWQHERIMISAAAAWDDVTDILSQRVQEMRSQTPAIPLLVRWTLAAADVSIETNTLRHMAERAVIWLRKQYGSQSESCWPVSVEVDAHQQILASAYEEDTLLGDYLRSVRQLQEDRQLSLLEPGGAARQLHSDLQWIADLSESTTRAQVLREATALGSALLRGEKVM